VQVFVKFYHFVVPSLSTIVVALCQSMVSTFLGAITEVQPIRSALLGVQHLLPALLFVQLTI